MSEVNRVAARGFARAALAYERARPTYPAQCVDLVREQLGVTGSAAVFLDLAAGTGKFTELLVRRGLSVVAVEPVAEMRMLLASHLPSVDVRDGSAEAIPVPDRSVDVVTVAQAFHWFDANRAIREIARVLRPGGGVALIWNRRLLDDPVQAAIEAIVQPHRGSTPSHRTSAWPAAFAAFASFTPFTSCELPHEQSVDVEAVVDRVLSTSFIAALAHDSQRHIATEVRDAMARLDTGDRIALRYATEIHTARRRESG